MSETLEYIHEADAIIIKGSVPRGTCLGTWGRNHDNTPPFSREVSEQLEQNRLGYMIIQETLNFDERTLNFREISRILIRDASTDKIDLTLLS